MNKVYGQINSYSPIRDDRSRIVVCYGKEDIDATNAIWYEIYFDKTTHSFEEVRDAIIADIDAQTDAKILDGYQWTILHGDDAGKTINVWLSKENQSNFKAKHDTATQYPQLTTYPIVYKVGEVEEDGLKRPVYEHFQDVNELAQFYLGGLAYIEQTLAEGWQRKDSIDWEPYKAYFQDNDDNT
ncbi:MAG: hypothetical protein IKP66_04835 [Lachnospiraceae bacterium]|nr:hypothetical protein [Lachnospiraceae bacterium]